MEREVMWVSFDEKVFEHVRLVSRNDAIVADGVIIHLDPNRSFRLRYRIDCDSAWQVRKVELQRLDDSTQSLALHSDGKGRWTDARGEIVSSLKGCRDIDIYYSPFTNTLAIRRLALKSGESADVAVAFITVPEMEINAVEQRYTLLETNAQGGRYRYESLSSGFQTDLPVDSDGLVIEYPKFFKRIWAR